MPWIIVGSLPIPWYRRNNYCCRRARRSRALLTNPPEPVKLALTVPLKTVRVPLESVPSVRLPLVSVKAVGGHRLAAKTDRAAARDAQGRSQVRHRVR